MQYQKMTLLTVAGGALPELFEKEARAIMENIDDPNTDAKKPRRLTITIDFQPSPDRTLLVTKARVEKKIVPTVHVEGTVVLSRANGRLEAYTNDIRQSEMYQSPTIDSQLPAPRAAQA